MAGWELFRDKFRRNFRRVVLRWRTRKLGIRRVFSNVYGHYALTHDNEVVFLSDTFFRDYELPLWPILATGHMQRVACILAAQKDPELAHLVPARGPDDTTCPDCGGSGKLDHPPEELLRQCQTCWCAGIGWLPDGHGPFEMTGLNEFTLPPGL